MAKLRKKVSVFLKELVVTFRLTPQSLNGWAIVFALFLTVASQETDDIEWSYQPPLHLPPPTPLNHSKQFPSLTFLLNAQCC